jgi:hypothetical protein
MLPHPLPKAVHAKDPLLQITLLPHSSKLLCS